MEVSIDKKKVLGAIVVLENYLDGALADYEIGDVENTGVIEDCIYVHRMLDLVLSDGWLSLEEDEYKKRFEKAKKEKKEV